MKLKHLLIPIISMLLTGCRGDQVFEAVYTYGNATDKTIMINSYTPTGLEDEPFLLHGQIIMGPGRYYSMYAGDAYHSEGKPFSFISTGPFDGAYITVTNGEKTFTQYYSSSGNKNTLYDEGVYSKNAGAGKGLIYYRYVFTDADFIDAEPIE